jgi:hypothetical protein
MTHWGESTASHQLLEAGGIWICTDTLSLVHPFNLAHILIQLEIRAVACHGQTVGYVSDKHLDR